jgi:Fe-S oxidoreductase
MKLFLDWSSYENAGMGDAYADIPKSGGDFAKAVAVCINSRQCEQHGKGVMCPSYRVTNNTLLSPGGRVKLLKRALNSAEQSTLLDTELAEAMKLCVSCKGCKRECENEVDMALIKAEYLAQLHQAGKLGLRHKLWAHLPRLLNQKITRHLVASRNRHSWLAKIGEKLFGIAARARLPEPITPTPSPAPLTDSPEIPQTESVVLFVDTFNRHFHPEVGEAAFHLLQAAGYEVLLPGGAENSLCCGRTYFNNGMIDKAEQHARELLQALLPHLAAGRWIVGLEPSCILSLRDEYLKMHLGDAAASLAERVLLLEEFIAREQTAGRWSLKFNAAGKKLLVHGHCHQKAVGAMKAMRKVLKSVQGLDFELLETSCCGMAGHFGLEAEHYDISQNMAELALFPALRAEPEADILSNGFSCRLQITNGGFQQPQHIAQLLYSSTVKHTEPA